jgi:hypothetical protein
MATLVKNNLVRVIGCGRSGAKPILLHPGNTPVTAEELETLQANPVLIRLFDKQDLVVLRTSKPPKPTDELPLDDESEQSDEDKPFNIGSVPVREAAGIINETYNVALLREWLEADERSTVQRDIKRQLERIESESRKEQAES